MSDIEILLRELINKVEYLNQKMDILNKKVDRIKIMPQMTWGDDSNPNVQILPVRTTTKYTYNEE